MTTEDPERILRRFLSDNRDRIEENRRIWGRERSEIITWILEEGLEQLEAHTGMIMLHQEVSV